MNLTVSFVAALFFGGFSAYQARRKGRNPLTWFALGSLFGLIGFLWILLLPPLTQPQTAAPVAPASKTPYRIQLMQKTWYYLNAHRERLGPMDYDLLLRAWRNGDLNERTYVWSEGMEEWKRIEEMPELYGDLSILE
jgi:hypothetical protein